jgi:hypothetical protein
MSIRKEYLQEDFISAYFPRDRLGRKYPELPAIPRVSPLRGSGDEISEIP